MRKTVAAKLKPSKAQSEALKQTLHAYAGACNQALKVARDNNVKRAVDIHRLCYYIIKAATGLTSNYVVRVIGRVAQSFGKKRPPKEFRPTSLDLDKDLIRFIPQTETVSISTIQGRQKIKLQLGNYQRHLLRGQKPTAGHLVYNKRLSGKQKRMMSDVNHQISKRLVAAAKESGRAIALEDLTGIRERAAKGRRMRKCSAAGLSTT